MPAGLFDIGGSGAAPPAPPNDPPRRPCWRTGRAGLSRRSNRVESDALLLDAGHGVILKCQPDYSTSGGAAPRPPHSPHPPPPPAGRAPARPPPNQPAA